MQRIYFLFLIFLVSGCTTIPTIGSLQQWHDREVRLDTITRNILFSNLQFCPEHRKDYGYKAIWLTQNSPEVEKIWTEAFRLEKAPTIITIIPNAAADRAGLRVGDAIVSVNGIRWSISDINNSAFIKELQEAQLSSTMLLGVRQSIPNETEVEILVTGDDICDAYVRLIDDSGAYAYAYNRLASIESGLEKLLRDDELAFIVSHEIAHIILKHVVPGREKDLEDKSIRSAMEKEADEMAIRLMIGAGYNPVAATTAIMKFDRVNRGPITRFLGLYGAYMPTEERVDFLKSYIAEVDQ